MHEEDDTVPFEPLRAQQTIDITSKLGDLTVEQFIMLMHTLQPTVSTGELRRITKIEMLSKLPNT